MNVAKQISKEDFFCKPTRSRVVEENDNQKASFTHYLYHAKHNYAHEYKRGAVRYVHDVLSHKYPKENMTLEVAESVLQYYLPDLQRTVPFPEPEQSRFTFIDLFAGIGGFRVAMQNLGGACVFSSEWDKYSQKTYAANFGEIPFGDITKEETKQYIPETFDLLCAGFPCQAFSIAGKRGGFEDTRGTLFFEVAKIIKQHQPKAFFLENVKGLVNHDKGRTLNTILHTLREDLGYNVPDPQIFNAKHFGVPQNRERIFIVGFRKDIDDKGFTPPQACQTNPVIADIIEKQEVSVKYYLSNQYLNTLIKHKARHESKGNGFGYEIVAHDTVANAVVCGGMGRERNLIYDHRLTNFSPVTHIKGEVNRQGIRKMTPREWARLQGFPDQFQIVVADAQAYRQFGNSVAVPAIQAMGEQVISSFVKS
jgi:DNA (cytosine-5)-methyltransferase 1